MVEALGSFFLASSFACLAARAFRSALSRSSAASALPARSLTSRAARSRAACRLRLDRQLLLEGGQTLGDRGFNRQQSVAGLERLLAGARPDLRAVHRDLGKPHQPLANQRCHALRQQPIEDIDLLDPKIRKPVIVHRHPARQPAIGDVGFDQPCQFSRRAHPLDGGVKPQPKQHRRIGRRSARGSLARQDLRVKLVKIEALDKAPDNARAVIGGQKPVKVDHIPAQLPPVRPYHPRFGHRLSNPLRIKDSGSQ